MRGGSTCNLEMGSPHPYQNVPFFFFWLKENLVHQAGAYVLEKAEEWGYRCWIKLATGEITYIFLLIKSNYQSVRQIWFWKSTPITLKYFFVYSIMYVSNDRMWISLLTSDKTRSFLTPVVPKLSGLCVLWCIASHALCGHWRNEHWEWILVALTCLCNSSPCRFWWILFTKGIIMLFLTS